MMSELAKLEEIINKKSAEMTNLGWDFSIPVLTPEGQGITAGLEWVLNEIKKIRECEKK